MTINDVPKELLEFYRDLTRLKRNYPVLKIHFNTVTKGEPLIIQIVAAKDSKRSDPRFTYTYEYNVGLVTNEKLSFLKSLTDLKL